MLSGYHSVLFGSSRKGRHEWRSTHHWTLVLDFSKNLDIEVPESATKAPGMPPQEIEPHLIGHMIISRT